MNLRVKMIERNMFPEEYWMDTETKVEFIPTDQIPKDMQVTAVKALIFKKNRLLLARVPRGWDFPGGHVEEDETLEQATIREVFEETGRKLIDYKMIGYLQLTKMKENELNSNYPYLSAIVIFISNNAVKAGRFDYSRYEAKTSQYFPINELSRFHHNWTPLKAELVKYSLAYD